MPRSIVLSAFALALGCTDGRGALGAASTRVTDPVRDFGKCTSRTITNAAVGAIRIGMTTAELRAICNVVHDSVELRRPEGYAVRVMAVLVGEDTVNALVDDSVRVTGIEVVAPSFATADSLRIGTTLGRLLRLPGATVQDEGGIDVVRVPAMCGLAFEVGSNYTDFPVASLDSTSRDAPPPWRPVILIDVQSCG